MNSQQQQQYRMFGIDPRAAAFAALGTAGVYGANALLGGEDERWDRTAINTAGNIIGAGSGALLGRAAGFPGMVAGAVGGGLLGGYASDRIANMVDGSMGLTPEGYENKLLAMENAVDRRLERIDEGQATVSPEELIAYHLQSDPIAQQAYYQEQLRQARMQKKEMDRQRALQYQAQMAQMRGM